MTTPFVCSDIDAVLTSVVAVYALVLILVPVQMHKKPFVIFLMFFFFLYSYNHIALTYMPDGQSDVPDWLSLVIPIVLALASVMLLNLARWVLAILFVLVVTMLFAQVLFVAVAASIAILVTLLCFCCVRSCQSAGSFERIEAFVQSIVVSAAATTLVVVAVGALYDYLTNADFSGLERCDGRTNTLLLCDYRCASLTTAGDSITWQGIWAGTVIAVTAIRVLFLNMCGYRDWRMLTDRCCSNNPDGTNDHDQLRVSAVDESVDIELTRTRPDTATDDSPPESPRNPRRQKHQQTKKPKKQQQFDPRDSIG